MTYYHKIRCPLHDYRSKSIYLVTISKAPGIPDFAVISGKGKQAYSLATDIGEIIKTSLRIIPKEFPQARLLQYIIMPDHIHFVIDIMSTTDYHLGELIARFTGNCTRAYGRSLFESGFHDRILRRKNQLRNMIDYVKDNPRRLLIKREHANLFRRPVKIDIDGNIYHAFGNFMLLKQPCKAAVRISRRFSTEELTRRRLQWEETVREGGVLISPFISPAEREVRDYAIENGGNIILLTRDYLDDRFKPAGVLFDLCAEGRLLVLSTGAPNNGRLSRAEALAMNDLAESLAMSTAISYVLKY